MSYFTPVPAVTGALHTQPRPEDTRVEWYFDANLVYQETGFIDAPDLVPSGGERLLRLESYDPEFRLGVATLYREER